LVISFSATALVGFHSVPDVVVVVVVELVDVEAVVLEEVFFDEPLPLAVVVVDFGPFVVADFVEGPFVEGPFAVEAPFVVVVLVVFGELDLPFVGAASTVSVKAAAATRAAGSAIHLVIAPPTEAVVEQGTYLLRQGTRQRKLLISKG
jgi:hypothetical protein